MKRSQIVAAGIFAVSASGAAQAATSVDADEALWRAAVGTFAFEDFDGFATGTEINTLAPGLLFDPLDDGAQSTVQPWSFTGGLVRSGPNTLLNDRDDTLPGRGPIGVRPIDPTDFIFGPGLWNVGGDDKLMRPTSKSRR